MEISNVIINFRKASGNIRVKDVIMLIELDFFGAQMYKSIIQ